MELAYVAHSARCALLLDEDGICRWFLMKVDDEKVAATAKRCIGAQFVATLDPEATGLLGHEPAVGKNVLFARVDDGRVTLVRFGPLVEFETLSGAVEAPDATVAEPTVAEPTVAGPTAAEPELAVQRRLTLVASPPPPAPVTLQSLETAPSGFAIRAVSPADDDNVETTAFERAVIAVASRRGMLPRRG